MSGIDLPDDLKDTPMPSDAQVAECPRCKLHFDQTFGAMTATVTTLAERFQKHPSDVVLAIFRVYHMRGHYDRPL